MIRLGSGWFCAFGACTLLACGPADEPPVAAAPPPRVRAEIAEPARADVRLSPDGSWLAFRRASSEAPGLRLAPASNPAAARPVVLEGEAGAEAGDGGGGAVADFRWAYSGDRLLCLTEGGADRVPRLFAVDAERGAGRALTPADRAARLVHLSPSHPLEAVIELAGKPATEPAGELTGEPTGEAPRLSPAFGDLYLLHLETGDLELLAVNEGYTGWGFDDDFDLRLAFAEAEDGLLMSQRAEMGEWVDFSWVPAEDVETTRFLGFDASANVAYFLDGRGRDRVALVGSHVISGRGEVIVQDSGADVTEVLFHPVRRTPQAAAAGRHGQRWVVLDEALRADLGRLEELADGDLEIVDRALDDRRWLIAVVPWDLPRRFYLYDRETGEAELLFGGRPELVAAVDGEAEVGEGPVPSAHR